MQLFVRLNGSLERPRPRRESPDFGCDNDGELVFVDGDLVGELGIYVKAGDDTDPPTSYSYEAELRADAERLVVRVVQWTSTTRLHVGARPEVIECRVSDDRGRSWRAVETPPAMDAMPLVERISV